MLSLFAVVDEEAEAEADEDDIMRRGLVAKACAGREVCSRKASTGSKKGSRRGRRCRLVEGEDHMRCVFVCWGRVGDGLVGERGWGG